MGVARNFQFENHLAKVTFLCDKKTMGRDILAKKVWTADVGGVALG
jgi:hypothetical protein